MTGTVKICSLRRPEDGIVASEAGADFAGLIFAQARRQVTVEQAAEIVATVRSRPDNRTRLVGVFVNDDPTRINTIAERLALDYVQLNGSEPAAQFVAIERPIIKALRLPAGTSYDDARVVAERYLSALDPVAALLIDAHVTGAFGGTGQTGDWTLAARLAAEYPVILAGGLNPQNVGAAIETVAPLGVDVSSGVETDGLKDHEKIRAFVAAAREAFAYLPRHPERSDAVGGAESRDQSFPTVSLASSGTTDPSTASLRDFARDDGWNGLHGARALRHHNNLTNVESRSS